jgi:hypothetical protein
MAYVLVVLLFVLFVCSSFLRRYCSSLLQRCCCAAPAATALAATTGQPAPPPPPRKAAVPPDRWSPDEVARFLVSLGPVSLADNFDEANGADDNNTGFIVSAWARAAAFVREHHIDGGMLVANSNRPEELLQLFAGLEPPLPVVTARAISFALSKFVPPNEVTPRSTQPLAVSGGGGGGGGKIEIECGPEKEVNVLRVQLSLAEAALAKAVQEAQDATRKSAAALADVQASLEASRMEYLRASAEAAETTRGSEARIAALEADLQTALAQASTAAAGGDTENDGEDASAAAERLLENFCCPITTEVFADPVRTPAGHVFERSAIEAWVDSNSTCPITRQPLITGALVRDERLCAKIRALEAALFINAATRFLPGDEVLVNGLEAAYVPTSG